MSKIFSTITLFMLLVTTRLAFANDADLLTQMPHSTIRFQFHSVPIPDGVGVLELGRMNLSSGNILACALQFNVFPSGKVFDGELLIEDAKASYMWESRYVYHFWGTYSFDGDKKDYYELDCYYSLKAVTIGDFREYLVKINGSIH